MARRRGGRVTLVGAGPGHPDLITLKGFKALRAADVIFHDHHVDRAFLGRFRARLVYVGKRRGKPGAGQAEINRRLIAEARRGRHAVRLKGGDPSIFGRAGEELDALREADIPVEVVPGVTAALAAAAAAGVSLTRRGISSSVAFAVGHRAARAPVPKADTLAYYMAAGTAASVARRLLRNGWPPDTPVALIEGASLPGERVCFTTLAALERGMRLRTPATLLAGPGLCPPAGGVKPLPPALPPREEKRGRRILKGPPPGNRPGGRRSPR